jgi:hypothetical protein
MKIHLRALIFALIGAALPSCSFESHRTKADEPRGFETLGIQFPITLDEMARQRLPLLECFQIANSFFIYDGTFDGSLTTTSTQCRIICSDEELNRFLNEISYPGNRKKFLDRLKNGRILGFVNEGDQAYLLFFDKHDRMYDYWPRL